MAEDIGLGGRAGYYDGIGAARDVIQNHLLQLLALTAMEEPVSFNPKDLRNEKTKVLSAVTLPIDLRPARPAASTPAAGRAAEGAGLMEEEGISPKSITETYAAIKLLVETRRWAGVPFYLRTGKRLGRRVTEIAVVFKRAPHLPFSQTTPRNSGQHAGDPGAARRGRDHPVRLQGARSGDGGARRVDGLLLRQSFTEASPEAYERLILDVLLGEPSLFPQDEEVELSWKILDPVEKHWARTGTQPDRYGSGTWGPKSADAMMARDGRAWRRP